MTEEDGSTYYRFQPGGVSVTKPRTVPSDAQCSWASESPSYGTERTALFRELRQEMTPCHK